MFSEAILSRAAFELFSSSTPDRYIRKAREHALRASVAEWLLTGQRKLDDVLDHARRLWGVIVSSDERVQEEVELALLLASVSNAADEQVDRFLRSIALSTRRNAAWLSHLARNLYHERAENILVQVTVGFRSQVVSRNSAAAASVGSFESFGAGAESADELLTV